MKRASLKRMPSQKRTRQKLTSSQKRTSWKPTSSENLAWSKWTDPSRDRSGGFEASQVGWLSDRSLRDERAAGRRWSSGVERMVHGELRGPVPRDAPRGAYRPLGRVSKWLRLDREGCRWPAGPAA